MSNLHTIVCKFYKIKIFQKKIPRRTRVRRGRKKNFYISVITLPQKLSLALGGVGLEKILAPLDSPTPHVSSPRCPVFSHINETVSPDLAE